MKIQAPDLNPLVEKEEKLVPEIFYGIDICGNDQINFPEYISHLSNFRAKNINKSQISKKFEQSLGACLQKIWLLDAYLHEDDNYEKIKSILNIATSIDKGLDVRLYLRKVANQIDLKNKESSYTKIINLVEQMNKYIKADTGRSNNIPQIRICFIRNMSNFIHDRFAILDDSLWHFGSDVGASNNSLNATSYGWDATGAIRFFEELWEKNYE